MQKKVYQTHLANIDTLKHWLVHVWAERDHIITATIGQWRRRLGACDTCVIAQGDILNIFALNLHIALWSVC